MFWDICEIMSKHGMVDESRFARGDVHTHL
jgi:hypothetical protein